MLNSRVVIRWAGVCLFLICATITAAVEQSPKQEKSPDTMQIERGRYLARIAGCNDCHTPGYTEKGGNVPEEEWLTGNPLGWRGPWGTTYPSNLRAYMNRVSESQWIKVAHTAQFRPPMPWFALHEMTEDDLQAIYSFVRYLGPAGNWAPVYVPPDKEPAGPYVQFPMPPK